MSARGARWTPIAVGAVYATEVLALVSAAPFVALAPAPHTVPWVTVAGSVVAVLGGTLVLVAGLILLATRGGGPGMVWSGAALVAVSTLVVADPVARTLAPDASASLAGWCVRGAGLALCAAVLLADESRVLRLLAGGVPLFVATVGVLAWAPRHLPVSLDVPPLVHLLAEVVLVAGWSALALAVHRAGTPDVGPWPAWQLAVVLGATHLLHALDGGPVGVYSLVGASLVLLIGGRAVADSHGRRLDDTAAAPAPEEPAREDRTSARVERLRLRVGQADPGLARRLREDALREARLLGDAVGSVDDGWVAPATTVDVLGVVRSVVEGRRLRGTQVVVEADCDPASLRTHGRPAELASMVLNLVVNAERHAPDTAVRIGLTRDDDRVLVVVTDDGPGVAPERCHDLFERGIRGAGSRGRGLGLHVARTLARAAGGDLRLAPSLVGAHFELTLPADGRRTRARSTRSTRSSAGTLSGVPG